MTYRAAAARRSPARSAGRRRRRGAVEILDVEDQMVAGGAQDLDPASSGCRPSGTASWRPSARWRAAARHGPRTSAGCRKRPGRCRRGQRRLDPALDHRRLQDERVAVQAEQRFARQRVDAEQNRLADAQLVDRGRHAAVEDHSEAARVAAGNEQRPPEPLCGCRASETSRRGCRVVRHDGAVTGQIDADACISTWVSPSPHRGRPAGRRA